jgi:tetratricopeptide (TPR) repeat protein
MVAIARAIDPDRFRNRVRDATMAHNRAALKVMAAVPQSDQLPALSANLLALSLADCGERAEATTLLAKAQRRYPGDFWINHDLGMLYLDAETPQPDEAIRFLTTAVALKLDNPGARVNLGQALAAKNRQEEALDSFRDAVGIRPNFAPALLRIRAGLRGSARPQKSPNDKDK